MNKPVIHLDNVWKTYSMGDVEVNALQGLNLEVKSGEFLAIMGPSGSGKSTLMNLVGCLDYPTTGTVKLDGEDVNYRLLKLARHRRADFR